jgi:hypothetical protein
VCGAVPLCRGDFSAEGVRIVVVRRRSGGVRACDSGRERGSRSLSDRGLEFDECHSRLQDRASAARCVDWSRRLFWWGELTFARRDDLIPDGHGTRPGWTCQSLRMASSSPVNPWMLGHDPQIYSMVLATVGLPKVLVDCCVVVQTL